MWAKFERDIVVAGGLHTSIKGLTPAVHRRELRSSLMGFKQTNISVSVIWVYLLSIIGEETLTPL